jgi:hypothetical protein
MGCDIYCIIWARYCLNVFLWLMKYLILIPFRLAVRTHLLFFHLPLRASLDRAIPLKLIFTRLLYVYRLLMQHFLLDLVLCLFAPTTCFGLHTRPSSGGYYSSRSLFMNFMELKTILL